jgi:hypothetical protein
MAYFGTDFSNDINLAIGHDYSAYFDPARANEIIKEAFIKAIEIKYADITSQKNTDELFTLIKTGAAFSLTSNQIDLLSIPQYLHVLALQAKYSLLLYAKVTGATNAKPIVLTLDKLTNLRDGDRVVISGVQGNTAANGELYVKKLYDDFATGSFTFQLYSDEKLTSPVKGNGAYIKGGAIGGVILEWAKKKQSYRKYSDFNKSTVYDPYYEIGDGKLKMLPSDEVCTDILLDYVTVPSVYPDVEDSTTDLELSFPLRFIYFWKDEVAKLMLMYSRDTEGMNNENQTLISQP